MSQQPTERVRHRVRLERSAQLDEAADLIRAILVHSQELSGTGPASLTIVRHDVVAELTDPNSRDRQRVFAFRRFHRNARRDVIGGRAPQFDEATIRLARPNSADGWTAQLVGFSTGRDRSMRQPARPPEAAPSRTSAEAVLETVVAGRARTLGVAKIEVADTKPGDPLGLPFIVTLKHGAGSFRITAGLSPRSGHLEVTDTATARTMSDRVHARRGASRLAVERALERALPTTLGYLIGIHLGYADVTPDGPRYLQEEDGKSVGTAAAYMDLTSLDQVNQQLELKTLDERTRRDLHDVRHELIDRLAARKGMPEVDEHREVLFAMAPRVQPIVKKYGGRYRTPQWLDTPGDGLLTHTVMGVVPGLSNLLPAILTPDPAQQARYLAGSVSTALSRGLRRFQNERRQLLEEGDPAPPFLVYGDRIGFHLTAGGVGGGIDVASRLVAAAGQPVDSALVSEIAGRRVISSLASGVSDYFSQQSFSPVLTIAERAMAVAGRGEAVSEFLGNQKKAMLLYRAIPDLVAAEAPSDTELTELLTALRRHRHESRKTWQLIGEHDLSAPSLRTKLAPVRTPSPQNLLITRAGPSAVGLLAGTGMALALHEPGLAVLGIRPVVDTIVTNLLNTGHERDKARARTRGARRNNAHAYGRVDNQSARAQALVHEKLGLPAPGDVAPLPQVRRKTLSFGPFIKRAVKVSVMTAPASAVGYFVPDLNHLAEGLLLSGVLSQSFNDTYAWILNFKDHVDAPKLTELNEQISLAEDGPVDLAAVETELSRLADELDELNGRIRTAYSSEELPETIGDLPMAEIFDEITRRNSLILLERFRQFVADAETLDDIRAGLVSMTSGYDTLPEKTRAAKVAQAFDEWHEADVTALAKLEVMGDYLAEWMPPGRRLAAMGPGKENCTTLNREYVELARAAAGLWFVGGSLKDRVISDVTGRFAAVALTAALNNGAATLDPADPVKETLNLPEATRLLPAAAELIAVDIQRLKAGWSLDDLLRDAPRPASRNTSLPRYGGPPTHWLLSMLGHSGFRERYTARISDWLADLKSTATTSEETTPSTAPIEADAAASWRPAKTAGIPIPASVWKENIAGVGLPAEPTVLFRVAAPKEHPAVFAAIHDLTERELGAAAASEYARRLQKLATEPRPQLDVVLAETGGEIVGVCAGHRLGKQRHGVHLRSDDGLDIDLDAPGMHEARAALEAPEGYIDLLLVQEEHRERGIATGLLGTFLDRREERLFTLEPGTEGSVNAEACRKLGFYPVGENGDQYMTMHTYAVRKCEERFGRYPFGQLGDRFALRLSPGKIDAERLRSRVTFRNLSPAELADLALPLRALRDYASPGSEQWALDRAVEGAGGGLTVAESNGQILGVCFSDESREVPLVRLVHGIGRIGGAQRNQISALREEEIIQRAKEVSLGMLHALLGDRNYDRFRIITDLTDAGRLELCRMLPLRESFLRRGQRLFEADDDRCLEQIRGIVESWGFDTDQNPPALPEGHPVTRQTQHRPVGGKPALPGPERPTARRAARPHNLTRP